MRQELCTGQQNNVPERGKMGEGQRTKKRDDSEDACSVRRGRKRDMKTQTQVDALGEAKEGDGRDLRPRNITLSLAFV